MQSVNAGAITDWKALGADKKLTAGIARFFLDGSAFIKFILGYTMRNHPVGARYTLVWSHKHHRHHRRHHLPHQVR
jgi:hypothetical protein